MQHTFNFHTNSFLCIRVSHISLADATYCNSSWCLWKWNEHKLRKNRKGEAHIAEKIGFYSDKMCFHSNLPTLLNKICKTNNSLLCEGAFTLAKMFFWHTENLLGVKRKHIASIRKCNDILTSAI